MKAELSNANAPELAEEHGNGQSPEWQREMKIDVTGYSLPKEDAEQIGCRLIAPSAGRMTTNS